MTSTMRFDKWENSLGMPYGTVLQVVTSTYVGSEIGNSSTTYVNTGLTATITPRFANSIILIMVNGNVLKNNTNASNAANVRLLRDENTVKTITNLFATNTAVETGSSYSFSHIETLNSTSAVTYRTQFANNVSSSVIVHGRGQDGTMVIMEIAQ
jgi:hypothetical protein